MAYPESDAVHRPEHPHTAYLALGSNVGDRRAHLAYAYQRLGELPETELRRTSPVYETAPVGGPAGQAAFLNGAAELATHLAPRELLAHLQAIERERGRETGDQRTHWGPRTLDLDLLLYDEQVIDSPGLKVPHPRMHERWFVLRPLADLAPEAVHPVLNKKVGELLEQVVESSEDQERGRQGDKETC